MGIRAAINEKPVLAMGVAVGVMVVVVFFFVWHAAKGGHGDSTGTKAFYSDDDGKTWFVDVTGKPSPFDHDGKRAYRVEVFRCGSGEPFVGYVERYSDAVNAQLAEAAAAQPDALKVEFAQPPRQVRKPGESRWIDPSGGSQNFAQYGRVTTPTCPEGDSQTPTRISPSDPDNGSTN